jgi:VWFA-related protein
MNNLSNIGREGGRVVWLLLLCFCATASFGQADVPLLKANTRLVVLDVTVVDKTGQPVTGLTASDFQVYEDNKLQRIQSVEPPAAHSLPTATLTAGATATFDPAQPASFGQSPVTILVLDQQNTHFADSSFARRELHAYLAAQPAILAQPATLLTVTDNRFRLLQPFTLDRAALLHAVDDSRVANAWKLETDGKTETGPIERLDSGLRALEQIAQSYARIPGRKNLVWIGAGFPSLDPTSIDGNDAVEVRETLRHVTDLLLETRITLYAVDPTSTAAGLTEITDITQSDFAMAAGGLSSGLDPFNATEDFDNLGPLTGGRVVRGLNDIRVQIGTSVGLGAQFYTIAYTPESTSQTAAQFRSIKVVCLRPGLSVNTRSGYYSGESQQARTEETAAYDLTTAAMSTMPLNGLRVTVERDASAGAPADSYHVRVAADGLTWSPRERGYTASVYVMAVSLDAKGAMLGHTLHSAKANAGASVDLHDPKQTADFVFTAPPPAKGAPKVRTLRFVVRDFASGRMGSFDLPMK